MNPVDEREHFCPKCKVTLVDTRCPRCGGMMVLASLGEGTLSRVRSQRLRRIREESSASLDSASISIDYFRQRRYNHAHRDDS